MPDTLCITNLQDGRRALCYLNQEEGRAQLVLVLRPRDLEPRRPPILRNNRAPVPVYGPDGTLLGHVEAGEFLTLPIPTHNPKPPRITPQDLLNMAPPPAPPEDPARRILRDIQGLAGGGPEQHNS